MPVSAAPFGLTHKPSHLFLLPSTPSNPIPLPDTRDTHPTPHLRQVRGRVLSLLRARVEPSCRPVSPPAPPLVVALAPVDFLPTRSAPHHHPGWSTTLDLLAIPPPQVIPPPLLPLVGHPLTTRRQRRMSRSLLPDQHSLPQFQNQNHTQHFVPPVQSSAPIPRKASVASSTTASSTGDSIIFDGNSFGPMAGSISGGGGGRASWQGTAATSVGGGGDGPKGGLRDSTRKPSIDAGYVSSRSGASFPALLPSALLSPLPPTSSSLGRSLRDVSSPRLRDWKRMRGWVVDQDHAVLTASFCRSSLRWSFPTADALLSDVKPLTLDLVALALLNELLDELLLQLVLRSGGLGTGAFRSPFPRPSFGHSSVLFRN